MSRVLNSYCQKWSTIIDWRPRPLTPYIYPRLTDNYITDCKMYTSKIIFIHFYIALCIIISIIYVYYYQTWDIAAWLKLINSHHLLWYTIQNHYQCYSYQLLNLCSVLDLLLSYHSINPLSSGIKERNLWYYRNGNHGNTATVDTMANTLFNETSSRTKSF